MNPKDPVALNLFTQKDLVQAKKKLKDELKEKKEKKKKNKNNQYNTLIMNKLDRQKIKCYFSFFGVIIK